jgi:NAD(P)H-dependent flavin oxidoreductase YrpB (nitropropane dioxygenase family)
MPASGSRRKSWTSTRVAQQLGIDYPIIQPPFGGLPSQRLTATVSNLGRLGSLGAVKLGSSAISEVIAEIRGLTSKTLRPQSRTNCAASTRKSRCCCGRRWPGRVGCRGTWGTRRDGVDRRGRKTRPRKRAGRFRRTPECAYVSAVEVARCP